MVLAAYFFGAPVLVTATAVTALGLHALAAARRCRRLRHGHDRERVHHRLRAVPRRSFVALLLREDDGVLAIVTFILVTIASDIGGYAVGVLFGKHPMAPVISPKKSWEGFAGSAVSCVLVGWLTVDLLLDGDWWVGVVLGLIAVVMATLGDLCESVIKRDLGIKDMSQIIPGPRRPDGPARLAARHRGPDLAAAALPRAALTAMLHLVRHGRPLVDPATPPHTWPLDPSGLAAVDALRASGRLPADAAWFSSPEAKARATAARLTDRPVTVVDDLAEHRRGVHWFDSGEAFAAAVRSAFDRPDEPAVPEWEPLSLDPGPGGGRGPRAAPSTHAGRPGAGRARHGLDRAGRGAHRPAARPDGLGAAGAARRVDGRRRA